MSIHVTSEHLALAEKVKVRAVYYQYFSHISPPEVLFFRLFRLVNKHDRDTVADGITPSAFRAYYLVPFEFDILLAGRTSQYFQKFLVYHD